MLSHMLRAVNKQPPITLSFIGSLSTGIGTTATATQAMVATAAIGDLAICWNVSYGNTGNSGVLPTSVVPSGFTSIVDFTFTGAANFRRGIASAKILTAGDIGSTLTGMAVSLGGAVFYVSVFRGSRIIQNFTFGSINSQFTSAIPTTQTITPPGSNNLPFLAVGYLYGTSATPSGTMTPAHSAGNSGGAWGLSRFRIDNTTAQSTTVASTVDNGINALTSFYIIPAG